MMRNFLIPFAVFATLSVAFLLWSDALPSVSLLCLGALAVAFLAPATLACRLSHIAPRLAICAISALCGVLLWDPLVHFVIVKAEAFFILMNSPWRYLAGLLAFFPLSFGTAWLAKPLGSVGKSSVTRTGRGVHPV